MKTTIDVSFELVGIERRDKFALHDNPKVKSESQALVGELAQLANTVLGDIDWPGSFPAFPQDRLQYEQLVQQVLAPASILAVANAIKPVFDRLRSQVIETLRLLGASESEHLNALIAVADWSYELRPTETHVCIPSEPPPGGHICELSVYFVSGASAPLKLAWPIKAGNEVFTYTIDCFMRFKVI